MWVFLALGSAFLTAVLGTVTKVGLEKVNPTLALAVQGTVMTALTWGAVFFGGKMDEIAKVEGRSWAIMLFAGALMLAANLLYYRALGSGPSSGAQPIDRLSLVFAVILAALFLKEKATPPMIGGVALMAVGAILIAVGAPKK